MGLENTTYVQCGQADVVVGSLAFTPGPEQTVLAAGSLLSFNTGII